MAKTVDVAELLDHAPISAFQIRIAVLCWLTLFLDGIDNQAIAYVAPTLIEVWHLGKGALRDAFEAGVLGVALGALATGPLADRFGRKPVLVATVVYFALVTLAIPLAHDIETLTVLRFFGGLGLGSLVPMGVVITREFAPRRYRATMVTLATCGYAVGNFSGGFLAAELIPRFGWQSVFVVGGILPLVLAGGLVAWIPESVRLLALRRGSGPRIARILAELDPRADLPPDTAFTLSDERPKAELRPFQLFTDGRTAITLLIWFAFFMNLLVLNMLNNWLPVLVTQTGLDHDSSRRVAAFLPVGGIFGVITMGVLADRVGFYRVLAVAFVVGSVFVGLIGSVGAWIPLLTAMIAVAGFCNIGSQITLAALAATLYPTDIRSTGVSWAHGVARVCSIGGIWLAGKLLDRDAGLQSIFLIYAVPMALAAVAVLVMQRRAAGSRAGAAANEAPA